MIVRDDDDDDDDDDDNNRSGGNDSKSSRSMAREEYRSLVRDLFLCPDVAKARICLRERPAGPPPLLRPRRLP